MLRNNRQALLRQLPKSASKHPFSNPMDSYSHAAAGKANNFSRISCAVRPQVRQRRSCAVPTVPDNAYDGLALCEAHRCTLQWMGIGDAIFFNGFVVVCPVQPHPRRYFRFHLADSYLQPADIPPRKRGVSRSSRTLGRDAADAAASGAQAVIAGQVYPVSDQPARRRTALQRLRQNFDGLHMAGRSVWPKDRCVRRSRVVLASVADVKSAEVCKARPGDANRQFAGDGDKTNSSPGSNCVLVDR
jgi:hypothetical protein